MKKIGIVLVKRLLKAVHRLLDGLLIDRTTGGSMRNRILDRSLDSSYQEMAEDEEHEKEALEWAEAMIADIDS